MWSPVSNISHINGLRFFYAIQSTLGIGTLIWLLSI
jgi:hypothetical protein